MEDRKLGLLIYFQHCVAREGAMAMVFKGRLLTFTLLSPPRFIFSREIDHRTART